MSNTLSRALPALALFVASTAAAQATPAAPQQPQQPMGFFITSAGKGDGANLGGLAGADEHCQTLARAAGAGSRTWRCVDMLAMPLPTLQQRQNRTHTL